LLVFGFEISEEFVETLVFLGHFPDGLIERFALLGFVGLYEILKFFNLLDGAGLGIVTLFSSLLGLILEKEHLGLLILIFVWVDNHLFVHSAAVKATVDI
jgi:hypothetical protein